MSTYPGDYAVPGLIWPGFMLPGEPVLVVPGTTVSAVFRAGAARGLWTAGEPRARWTAGAPRGLWSTEGALDVYSQSVLSGQYVQIPVTAFGTAGTYNPTGDIVQFAFTPANYPVTEPAVWLAASWATYPGPAYYAQCLVGPGTAAATALTIGTWQVWVKITDNPEIPVLQPSLLQITP